MIGGMCQLARFWAIADTQRRQPAFRLVTYCRKKTQLTSDIWGANKCGWDSILLRTGVYAGGEPSHKPTMICDDVELAVEWAIENELRKGATTATA